MHCYLAVQFREMRTKVLFTKENPCMTRTISPGRGAFDIDEGTTQLSLELSGYDPSADAEHDSWLLLEPKETD